MQKIAIGTVQFGIDYGVSSTPGKVQRKEVSRILNYAKLQGINVLDTALSYGDSELVLGECGVDGFNVITKTRSFDNCHISQKVVQDDFFHSLKNLRQDSIYGVLVHNANDLLKPSCQVIIDSLNELKIKNKIKKIGVSVYNHTQLQNILHSFDIDLVQVPFNIMDRRIIDSGMLSSLNKKGIEVHARSVFLQGLLLMSLKDRPSKFGRWDSLWRMWHEWLNDNGITALEAAMKYAISRQELSRVLVGVDSEYQLREIVASSVGTLPNIPSDMYTNDPKLLDPYNWGEL